MEKHNWDTYFHPAFAEVFQRLVKDVDKICEKNPSSFQSHPKSKFLKKLKDLIFKEIPQDPNNKNYFLGNTLGQENKHWRRAKLFKRFRLFFQFNTTRKVIIYAWLNDENTKRKEGSKNDPYSIFKKRLAKGCPPDNWKDLLEESELHSNT